MLTNGIKVFFLIDLSSDVAKLRLSNFCFMGFVFLCGLMLQTTGSPVNSDSIMSSCYLLINYLTVTKRIILSVSLFSMLNSCNYFAYKYWTHTNEIENSNFGIFLVSFFKIALMV
jgi:hypothetical protein